MFVESVVPESGLITLRAYSAPQSTKDKRSKSWEKVKFLQLIQEIAGRHGLTLLVAHQHHGTLAELTFDLTQGRSQGFLLVVVH